MSAHRVELSKPADGAGDHLKPRHGERFDKGERIILVDGERWGRTVVTSHGVHGMKHRFLQDDRPDFLSQNPASKYPVVYQVMSRQRRSAYDSTPIVPTFERVRLMAADLVDKRVLRHPSIIAAEDEDASIRYRMEATEARAKEAQAFKERAEEALRDGDAVGDRVAAVVAAMRWAQTF